MGPVINLFSREKVIINKERQSGSYRLSTYYFSKILSEIPNNLIGPLIYGTIVYFGT
jgi:ATP-binding cassette, subfamily G (WHITE), member 2